MTEELPPPDKEVFDVRLCPNCGIENLKTRFVCVSCQMPLNATAAQVAAKRKKEALLQADDRRYGGRREPARILVDTEFEGPGEQMPLEQMPEPLKAELEAREQRVNRRRAEQDWRWICFKMLGTLVSMAGLVGIGVLVGQFLKGDPDQAASLGIVDAGLGLLAGLLALHSRGGRFGAMFTYALAAGAGTFYKVARGAGFEHLLSHPDVSTAFFFTLLVSTILGAGLGILLGSQLERFGLDAS